MELIPGLTNDLARECLIRLPFKALGFILSVCKAWNSEIRSLDFHRHRKLSGYTRPWFVLSQILLTNPSQITTSTNWPTYTVTILDPIHGFCEELPPGPDLPFTRSVNYCRVAVFGTKVVVFIAGRIDRDVANVVVHVFDLLTFRWHNGAVMPGPGRAFFGLASDSNSGKVLVAGGFNGQTTRLTSALLYDVESDTWQAVGDMENGRYCCDLIFHGGMFHVVNGRDQSQDRCLAAESLDPNTWQWAPHVEGEFVEADLDFQNVMENGEGDVYRFSIGQVEVRRGSRWQVVAESPVEFDLAYELVGVMTWRNKMMVIRAFADSIRFWGFILDLKNREWTKMILPEHINSDNPIFGCGIEF